MKRCAKCRVEQSAAEFGRCARARDGLQSWCRSCKAALAREAYRANPEPARAGARARMRARRAAEPQTMRDYIRRWREANPERVRAADAARRGTPERKAWQAAYWREWKLRHPEAARLIARRGQQSRRARLAGAYVETVDPLVVLERSAGVCGICGEAVDRERFDVDHIVPLALGGEHSYENTQASHPSCNYSKGARVGVAA